MVLTFGENAAIHAFEPIDVTYTALCENTSKYANIIQHNMGCSDISGVKSIYTTEKPCSELSSVYQQKDHRNYNLSVKKESKFTTIDNFCERDEIDHIHFLKIDVEGHEMPVLKGAKRMLERGTIDFIQFEFGGCV